MNCLSHSVGLQKEGDDACTDMIFALCQIVEQSWEHEPKLFLHMTFVPIDGCTFEGSEEIGYT